MSKFPAQRSREFYGPSREFYRGSREFCAYSNIEVGEQRFGNVRFEALCGLTSDVAPSPRSANNGHRRSFDHLVDAAEHPRVTAI
jgi:hypothetical protein